MKDVETIFAKELNFITDPKVREFVIAIFQGICPDYFWAIPASSTGDHHPGIGRGEGGLVRHTKLTTRFARAFMQMWPTAPETAHDEVIAACLLHDMMKRGKTVNEQDTFKDRQEANTKHGVYCAWRIREYLRTHEDIADLLPEDRAGRIITAVRDHLGKWTANYTSTQEDVVERTQVGHVVCITTHLADYTASRTFDAWLEEILDEEDI
jgi:hypothetical protein